MLSITSHPPSSTLSLLKLKQSSPHSKMDGELNSSRSLISLTSSLSLKAVFFLFSLSLYVDVFYSSPSKNIWVGTPSLLGFWYYVSKPFWYYVFFGRKSNPCLSLGPDSLTRELQNDAYRLNQYVEGISHTHTHTHFTASVNKPECPMVSAISLNSHQSKPLISSP